MLFVSRRVICSSFARKVTSVLPISQHFCVKQNHFFVSATATPSLVSNRRWRSTSTNSDSSSSSSSSMQKKALNALLSHSRQIPSSDEDGGSISQTRKSDEQNSKDTPSPSPSKVNGLVQEKESVQQQQQQQVQPPKPYMERNPALHEFAPKIVVVGVGGAGGNALNNMISKESLGGSVEFIAMNTDAQHLSSTLTDQRLQLGMELTQGLGCGANPNDGRLAAEESREEITACLKDKHLVFITAGMGGGTGTGAAPVVADICDELGILSVGVVTLPFSFEGTHRRRLALEGIENMQNVVDTLIVIPNQNLFQIAGPQTSFVDAFQIADDVLLGGVKCITDLMTSPGLINLDFADVKSVMVGMGNAILGTGLSTGDNRAIEAAMAALENPLLGSNTIDVSTAKGMLVNITGGRDMTLFEVDKAAQYITERVKDESANIIFGSAYDASLEGSIRVSVVATGIDTPEYLKRSAPKE